MNGTAGIEYLHSQSIVHRDMSSRNLLRTRDGRVKICDFGCARIMKEYSYKPSFISGSPPWMAPEQIMGKPITMAVDVFAYGAVLWEFLTGKMPFQARMAAANVEMLQRVCRSEKGLPAPPDSVLGSIHPDVKASIRSLIVATHNLNPALRPSAGLVRQVAEGLASAMGSRHHSDGGKGHVEAIQEVKYRQELGSRMTTFYKKHNPSHLTSSETLFRLLNEYQCDLDEYNACLRKRYKSDLNDIRGAKPLSPPPSLRSAPSSSARYPATESARGKPTQESDSLAFRSSPWLQPSSDPASPSRHTGSPKLLKTSKESAQTGREKVVVKRSLEAESKWQASDEDAGAWRPQERRQPLQNRASNPSSSGQSSSATDSTEASATLQATANIVDVSTGRIVIWQEYR